MSKIVIRTKRGQRSVAHAYALKGILEAYRQRSNDFYEYSRGPDDYVIDIIERQAMDALDEHYARTDLVATDPETNAEATQIRPKEDS